MATHQIAIATTSGAAIGTTNNGPMTIMAGPGASVRARYHTVVEEARTVARSVRRSVSKVEADLAATSSGIGATHSAIHQGSTPCTTASPTPVAAAAAHCLFVSRGRGIVFERIIAN